VIPLFPELRPYLEDAFDPEAIYVAGDLRQNTNVATTMAKIIKRAGIKPWPKLFQNLRSTRETELNEEYPMHVVCYWIGNSQKVAAKHYLQVTDAHFERETEEKSAAQALQYPLVTGMNRAVSCPDLQNSPEFFDPLLLTMEPKGLEPSTSSLQS
jgi:hypothetical protein